MKLGDLLPDSRAKETKNRIFTTGSTWIPFFCANCHKECGFCPEENMTFMFYLCTPCFKQWGHLTNTMVMPDEVFWAKLKEEMVASHGRYLTEQELAAVVEADASPLATLIKGRKT
jgi:hypothetical protein